MKYLIVIFSFISIISCTTKVSKDLIQPLYLTTGEIYYINYDKLVVEFESGKNAKSFLTRDDLINWIEDKSAYNAVIHGYQEDIKDLAADGYLGIMYYPEDSTAFLSYWGPNWTVNAQQDTTFDVVRFNTVEILDNKDNKKIKSKQVHMIYVND